jgi:hypothetical protein
MSDGARKNNPHGYIFIDATEYAVRQKRKKVTNSTKCASRKKQSKTLYCVLCGQKISSGGLLEHKELAHGEKIVPRAVQAASLKSHWIKLIQGGLPSLGKRK